MMRRLSKNMKSPFKGKFKVTSPQGSRILFGKAEYHDGLDLVGIDSKEIHSTVDGIVERAGWENSLNKKQGFGLYVRIKQNDSVDRYYFGHLSEIKVKVGDTVKIGDVIGVEGNTGKSTGSHCHYCVRGNASKSQIRDVCAISEIPNKIGTYENNVETETAKDVFYCVKSAGKWLAEVKNLEDYAGISGKPITDIAVKIPNENIKYRVHVYKGGWLPFVSGYNTKDYNNGFAGNGKPIDAIQICFAESGKSVFYRVSPLKSSYYSWQESDKKDAKMDGYAGWFGKKIDRLQIEIR